MSVLQAGWSLSPRTLMLTHQVARGFPRGSLLCSATSPLSPALSGVCLRARVFRGRLCAGAQRFPASCPRLLPSRGLGALPSGVSTAGRQSKLWGSTRSRSCFFFFPTVPCSSPPLQVSVPGSRVSLVTQLHQHLLRKSGATRGVGGTLSPGPDSPCLLSK